MLELPFIAPPPSRKHSTALTKAAHGLVLLLGDVCHSLGDVPSGGFAEPMPEIVEGGEVSRFDEDHAVVGGSPDVGVFSHYLYVLGEFFLETFPAYGCFSLVGL